MSGTPRLWGGDRRKEQDAVDEVVDRVGAKGLPGACAICKSGVRFELPVEDGAPAVLCVTCDMAAAIPRMVA